MRRSDHVRLNRTKMELKHLLLRKERSKIEGLNRTKMELKPVIDQHGHMHPIVLIEPRWN